MSRLFSESQTFSVESEIRGEESIFENKNK